MANLPYLIEDSPQADIGRRTALQFVGSSISRWKPGESRAHRGQGDGLAEVHPVRVSAVHTRARSMGVYGTALMHEFPL